LATPIRSVGPSRGKSPAPSTSRQVVRRAVKAPAAAAAHSPTNGNAQKKVKPEPKVLFQKFFKSIGPRTYGAQVKELSNGNHLLVLGEGKRDEQTGEVHKSRLFIYGEDFTAFFRMLHETATFIRANPLSEEFRKRREKFWARKHREASGASRAAESQKQKNF